LEKEPNSIKQVVARALDGLGPLGNSRPIEVRIPESLPRAAFDPVMIEKVIWLLLDNALKYSPPDADRMACDILYVLLKLSEYCGLSPAALF
jgi:two-component system, OmpR family, sensor histidine kinase KdpD